MRSEKTREVRSDGTRGMPGRGSGNRLLRALALAALLALTLPLAGCGGGGTSGAASTSSTPAPAPAMLSASAALPDGLTATLAEDKATVPVGGSVTYTLTLANNTSQPITFEGVDGYAAISVGGNLKVVDPLGQTVLPVPGVGGAGNSSGVTSLPVTLAPGQSTSATVSTGAFGDVFTAPGKYTTTATFNLIPSPSTPNPTVGPLTVTAQ